MMPFLRSLLPGTALTLSVGANDALNGLSALKRGLPAAAMPDFWSFHYYGRPELALGVLRSALALAAPLPIFVGETGYVNGDSDPSVRSESDREDEQLHYFRTLRVATSLLGLPPVAPWILYDLGPGASPLRIGAQEYHFGLFRLDETAKPVVAAIRSAFAGGTADLTFNGGFEQAEAATDPLPALWRHHGAGVFVRDDRVFHSGRGSISLSGIAGGVTARANFSTTPPNPWVSAGETTSVTAWARGAACTGTSTVSVRYYDGAGTFIEAVSSAPLPHGTTAWMQLTVTGVAPPNAVYFRIVLGSDQNRGRVWFDDVTLA
jgi:hypothetical protein